MKIILPIARAIDPDGTSLDLFLVDGASNVQKAGNALTELYPRLTTLHGFEHVVSLVFFDICKLHVVNALQSCCVTMYNFFMRRHGPHSMLVTTSESFFEGNQTLLVKHSETWMAGLMYVLLRLV